MHRKFPAIQQNHQNSISFQETIPFKFILVYNFGLLYSKLRLGVPASCKCKFITGAGARAARELFGSAT
jgi:hypothetical protein